MTLKDVARLAGVSPSAVSRYLNGGPLSEEKTSLIRQVIQRTGYVPNQAAHTLRTGRVRQVGLIVPRIHSEAVNQVAAGAAVVLERNGYLPVLGTTGRDPAHEERYLETMQSYHVAGVILMASAVTDELLRVYRSCRVPLVVTGQRIPGFCCVYHDDFHAMEKLARLLLKRGRRNITYIGVDPQDPAVGLERLRGAREPLQEAGVPLLGTETAGFDWKTGHDAMVRLLERFPDTDGVLCATDTLAHGAMLALRQAGRRIPADVSVAGVGDDWADLVSVPPLTTVELDQTACGREAASMLVEVLEHRDRGGEPYVPRQVCLGCKAAERESV